ncbi:hypothetical protein JMJ35_000771 [Cladonia borealis]|uniref:Duf1665 domain containing protein n=1 Tax=Cladonia borealis TaxID=184061 RepID=A0AA39R7B4_9LECA|nr:hypothetical protein JMJ35_000771 [Cladonia borealis]
MDPERIKLPGFGLPLIHTDMSFKNAVVNWWGKPLTVRELNMIKLMNQITDKPSWDRKVFDDTVTEKWRQEARDAENLDVTEAMLDWIIAELRDKAQSCRENGIIAALDLDAMVVKSDTTVSPELKAQLRIACKPLEDILTSLKDWHPGSDGKVLNLVHPSLFPLIYGRSRVLPTGKVSLQDCTEYIGKGEVVKPPDPSDIVVSPSHRWFSHNLPTEYWSQEFQWLPCDVDFAEEGSIKIISYINNLHPAHHRPLYAVIESLISKSVPLWNRVLSSIGPPSTGRPLRQPRINMIDTEYEFPQGMNRPKTSSTNGGRDREAEVEGHLEDIEEQGNNEARSNREDEEEDDYDDEENWQRATRVLVKPEPGDYASWASSVARANSTKAFNLRKDFAKDGIQVIVKLANIELTPTTPEYDGGSWHIEGQLNEHICASALYYYDSENVTENFLAFRQRVKRLELEEKQYGQDDYEGVEELYGVKQDEPALQEIGRVLTSEGRLLAFPNAVQHRVSPFRLADPARPGHRKILALFLVDPYVRILSTANVPPQQKSWWAKRIRDNEKLSSLPTELMNHVIDDVAEFPISLEEAKEIRQRLMEERKAFVVAVEDELQSRSHTFSFCEH